jgi:MFS superfamily sulfate permease-like transporter
VASVAVPVAIAYAQLAGFRPEVGLYSSILPLLAYAIFGTSRRLIINPDAAVCAMVAASVAPLAAGDPKLYASMSVMLAFLAGIFCILASFFRLGAVGDFLSKPILVGFMNGVAISIFQGQIGKICGFSIKAEGMLRWFQEVVSKLPHAHGPTLAMGLAALMALVLLRRLAPRAPASLIVLVVAGALIALLKLDSHGVAALGVISGGVPPPQWPQIPLTAFPALTAKAAGLALVIFSGGLVTARSFANKDHHPINMGAELAALGAANIASALGQGFAVTDADSRTAVRLRQRRANADDRPSRRRLHGPRVAVCCQSLAIRSRPGPGRDPDRRRRVTVRRCFPAAHLARGQRGSRALADYDPGRCPGRADQRDSRRRDACAGAVHPGTARPRDEILGKVEGMPGFHSIERHPGAQTVPGLQIYRFGGPITFFNAAYFKERALAAANTAGPALAGSFSMPFPSRPLT